MATALQRMTVEEFEAWSDARPGEMHELVDGMPRLMAGPGEPHAELQVALGAEVRARLKPPCRSVGQVGLVLDSYNERIPDLAIVCGERGKKRLVDAEAVIEILSDSTAAYDLGEKRLRYMQLPGLTEIWLVASDRRQLERWRRGDDGKWLGELLVEENATLASPLLTEPIPLGPLWAGVGL